jgi:hypothetical protein|tara:strand:+ start:106 stop:387 length:282 start_codon:yes stop_codon:yes gene_type:complete
MKTINRNKAKELIKESKGLIFSTSFIKKDNTLRVLTGRLKVTKYLKENAKKQPYDPNKYNLQPVYDLKAKGYRMLNLNTLITLSINKTKYIIK